MKEGQAAVKKHRENETEDREKKRSIAPAAWVSIARSSARPPPAAVAAMAAAFFAEEAGGPLIRGLCGLCSCPSGTSPGSSA